MTTPQRFLPLQQLFKTMDDAYEKTASQYNFTCKGCEDNCCTSLFFHHTLVEKEYLLYGFAGLASKDRNPVLDRAKAYVEKTFLPLKNGHPQKSQKIVCPLNDQGRCMIYPYRPMICRLHGLPHELHRPGAAPMRGKGCRAGNFDRYDYIKFDRTPFYREMAQIEMNFRQQAGSRGKIKLTVAQILLT